MEFKGESVHFTQRLLILLPPIYIKFPIIINIIISSWVFFAVPELKNDPKGLEQFFELDPTMYVASELGGELENMTNH